jgi:hypothetical protein
MRNFILIVFIFFIASLVFGASNLEAVLIDKTAFLGVADVITLDFELPEGTIVDTEYEAQGVTFAPGGVITFLSPGHVLSTNSAIVAQFSGKVNMVGLDFSSNSLLTLAAYDASDTLIESVTATSLNGFLGLHTDKMIAKAMTHDSGFGFTIDNFTIADPPPPVIPEPGTFIMLGSGLIGLGIYGLKRKRGF